MYVRNQIKHRIVHTRGPVTLSSGIESDHYFDVKPALFDSHTGKLFADWIREQLENVYTIGGMELGAVPIACTVMARAITPLRVFIVRKQSKDHGTRNRLEGYLHPRDRVAIVDDVITTGRSTLEAIRVVEEIGCKVAQLFCMIDRNEHTVEEFKPYRDRLNSMFTLSDFL